MVPITKVPDKILSRIISRLPLNSLLAVRLVCLRWHSVEKKVCVGKTSLKLFDQAKDVPTYLRDICLYGFERKHVYLTEHFTKTLGKPAKVSDEDQMQSDMMIVPEFTSKVCEALIHKFPNVEHLTIYYGVIRTPALIVLFGSSWNLKSLFLYPPQIPPNPFFPPYKIDWPVLWPLIDRMSNLKNLVLFRVSGDVQLPSLSLQHFALCDYEVGNLFKGLMNVSKCSFANLTLSHANRTSHEVSFSSKNQRALFSDYSKISLVDDDGDHNSVVGQILSNMDYSAYVLCRLVQTKPQFANQLTKLTLDCDSNMQSGVSEQLIQFICAQFKFLKSLNISLKSETKLSDLVNWLRNLPHLSELGLTSSGHMEQFPRESSFFSGDTKSMSPLPNILRLHLFIFIELEPFSALSSLFHNLVKIEFDYSSLRCHINGRVYDSYSRYGSMFEHLDECGVCRNKLARILGRFKKLSPKCAPVPVKMFSL